MVTCQVDLYGLSSCAGMPVNAASIGWINVDCGPTGAPMTFTAASNIASARVSCSVEASGDTNPTAGADLDFI
jgi:hypothetical protein